MTPRTRPWWHPVESRAADPGDPAAAPDGADPAVLAAPAADTADVAGVREPWADRSGVAAPADRTAAAPAVDDALVALVRAAGAGRVREPWADRRLEVTVLTTAQQAVLAGLDDQPHGPRLDNIAPELGTLAGQADDPGWPGTPDPPASLDAAADTGADRTARPPATGGPVAYGGAAGSAEELGEDQPGVPRMRPGSGPGEGPGNGTGNAPGDPAPPDPHTRTRWTEQEQQEG